MYFEAPIGRSPTHADARSPSLDTASALEFLTSECQFRNEDLPEGAALEADLARIVQVHAEWRDTLVRHKTKLFLIWGDTAPKSRLFIRLCEELDIEYLIIERGHFPGTLSYDPRGQFGNGVRPQLLDQHPLAGAPQPVGYIDQRFEAISRWYAEQDGAAYTHAQKRGTPELERIARARRFGRPVILVIGANDQGAGIVGPGRDSRRVNWFGGSNDAFRLLAKTVRNAFPDALLVLRPHPSQKFEDETGTLLVARDSALDDLIDAADVCIPIATTAYAICLLKGKPVLSLGLTQLTGSGLTPEIVDETTLLAALRRLLWSDREKPYPDDEHKRYIVHLFDQHLIAADESIPTQYGIEDFARFLASRCRQRRSGFLSSHAGQEAEISRAMFEDVCDRGRAVFRADARRFDGTPRPAISVVLPIYGDYEGTRICFEQLMRHQVENGYRVIAVWDRGPDTRLRDLCLEFSERAGFVFMENLENVGFSGAVNEGILRAGRDDVILLNSDTVPCGDWARRLQDAAYAHPKIASVVPFSNNATIYSIPFPDGMPLPTHDAVPWVRAFDERARTMPPDCVEMPVSHGFCTYVRRNVFDLIGLYSEAKFGKGHGEDNEFSLRARMAGYFCVGATNVFVGHAGSTSFGDEVMDWKLRGRATMRDEFSHYFEEISHFFANPDPLAAYRARILAAHPAAEISVAGLAGA